MININERIRCAKLRAKISTAEEAANCIAPGMNLGTSGFTPSGYPKVVPLALAERIKKVNLEEKLEKFQINLWTGASAGRELDSALTEVDGISRRIPYQTDNCLRKAINNGQINYADIHLSHVAQMSRYGYLGGNVDIAIIEALAITEEGHIVPTTALGNSASFVKSASKVIVEINTTQPLELEGMHDVYIPNDPPYRQVIPLTKPGDRIGTPYINCPADKISHIVPSNIKDDLRPLVAIDEGFKAMSGHLIEFLKFEIKAGRMPKNLLPLQSGVGSVANAAIAGLVDSDFENLSVYTEVVQDGILDLIDADKMDFVSATSLTLSPVGRERLYNNIGKYRNKILLRPQEISNNPEIIRRLGLIAMNTAIEFDIFGHVNSTHIMGSKMMNGIGGSGDFARNAYLTIFFSNSLAKGGNISSIVPMCSHVDHTEHDTHVFITERGVADIRGLSPKERARVIIKNCAHPDYQSLLTEYLDLAEKTTAFAHTPHIIDKALSFHARFLETGTMKIKI